MILSGLTIPTPLTLKDASCQDGQSHGLVHVQFIQMFPELILRFSMLSQGLGSPGFPEDNSSQKIIKQWIRHSVLQCFSCPLSPGILPNSMLALPSFPFAADIPVKALIICPQSHFHLFQLLSATVYISETQNHRINKVRKELWDHQV